MTLLPSASKSLPVKPVFNDNVAQKVVHPFQSASGLTALPRLPPVAKATKAKAPEKGRATKGAKDVGYQERLIDCEICCTLAVPMVNVTRCSIGHTFCKDCARRMAETQIGLQRSALPCMAMDGCAGLFEEREVRGFLTTKTFDLWERIRTQESIKAAGLEGLECCPYCDYGCVMENKEEKLFHCLNKACRKTSCRSCKKENHLPKNCLEYQIDLRERSVHDAEEQLSAVLMRRCPQKNCNTPIIKEETVKSCNKMTCAVCRKEMCYCCRVDVSIQGYRHFDMESDGSKPSNKCPLWDDSMERHKKDLAEARSRLGEIAPGQTKAEQQDEAKRRQQYEQKATMNDVHAEHGMEVDLPRQLQDHEREVHQNIKAKRRGREDQVIMERRRQQEQDLASRLQAVIQREERLLELGFLSHWPLGPPIHLRVDTPIKARVNAGPKSKKEAKKREPDEPSKEPPSSPPVLVAVKSSPTRPAHTSKTSTASSSTSIETTSTVSSNTSTTSAQAPVSSNPNRKMHNRPLVQAANRAFRSSS